MGYLQILKILFLEEFKHLWINTFFSCSSLKKEELYFYKLFIFFFLMKGYYYLSCIWQQRLELKKKKVQKNLLDQKIKSHEFIENKTFTDFQNVVLQTKSNTVTDTSILYSLFLFVFVVLFFVFAFYLRFWMHPLYES